MMMMMMMMRVPEWIMHNADVDASLSAYMAPFRAQASWLLAILAELTLAAAVYGQLIKIEEQREALR